MTGIGQLIHPLRSVPSGCPSPKNRLHHHRGNRHVPSPPSPLLSAAVAPISLSLYPATRSRPVNELSRVLFQHWFLARLVSCIARSSVRSSATTYDCAQESRDVSHGPGRHGSFLGYVLVWSVFLKIAKRRVSFCPFPNFRR